MLRNMQNCYLSSPSWNGDGSTDMWWLPNFTNVYTWSSECEMLLLSNCQSCTSSADGVESASTVNPTPSLPELQPISVSHTEDTSSCPQCLTSKKSIKLDVNIESTVY